MRTETKAEIQQLELLTGMSGDLKILKECKSQRCDGRLRTFERISMTPDKYHWVYTCAVCGNYYYTPTRPQDRVVRLVT